jgi:S1-C subfamily serine protease
MTSDHLPPPDDQEPHLVDDAQPAGDPASSWMPGREEPTVDAEIIDAPAPAAETEPAAATLPGGGHMWPPPPPGTDTGWAGRVSGWGPPPAPAPPRKRRGLPVVLAAGLIAAAAAAGVGIGHTVWGSPSIKAASSTTVPSGGSGANSGGASPYVQNPYGQDPFGNGESPLGNGGSGSTGSGSTGAGGPSDVSSIAGKIDGALVDINVKFNYQSSGGAGTGIVLTSNGEILTNNHVVDGATSISVTDVGNGNTYSATVVGYDPVHDIAVLQLQNASGLQTARLADSAKVAVGDQVVAVGNAGGQGGTPSAAGGAVTAINQAITASDELTGTSEQLTNLIQTNADVQSGDSGGALVNSQGQVVGMDTASNSNYSLTSSTQGFAIPINQAIATVNAIEAGQGSSDVHVGATAFLGVLLSSGNSGAFGGSTAQGAQISSVVSGGPAAAAGLTQGDTITSFDNHTVTSLSTISKALITHHPGDRVQIGWVDSSGQSHTATVTLASGPPA